jgi:hypothetical protein
MQLTQNLLPVREWGFKSLHPHHLAAKTRAADQIVEPLPGTSRIGGCLPDCPATGRSLPRPARSCRVQRPERNKEPT